ncbi:carbonic anhydrase [Methanolinea mesophila]|uniref:carbonic anhydrase n=1 Tax=Methanolinea mesophila TaxID=547055 RepID=UPI001AE53F17|nr:carbonic anhydrase [Methanolinea mesophila]
MIEDLILGNLKFRENDFNANIEYYRNLVLGQSPGVLWIGCSDSRVNPERITGAKPGEIFVQRNIGNIIPMHDWNFATVLEYAVAHLKIREIVICGHSECGAIKALDKDSMGDSYIPLWLNNACDAKTRVDARIPVPSNDEERKARSKEIEMENVRLQIEHLKTYPIIRAALADDRVKIYGLYYNLATGTLEKIT